MSFALSFWKVYRLIFVFLSLYLLGDAFYRWDGIRLHSAFSEFLIGFALTSILMGILAAPVTIIFMLTAPLINILYKAFQWLIIQAMNKVRAEHIHLFTFILITLSAIVWFGKRMLTSFDASWQLKILVLFCIVLAALLFTCLTRKKARKFIDIAKRLHLLIQERITPLVWIFALWVCISVFLVSYQTWFTGTGEAKTQKVIDSYPPDEKRPNIVLVTYDALTARHMSVYGYERETTPFIKEWAKTASVFSKAEASSNWTASTTASLMQGKRVWIHRRFSRMGESRPIGNNLENMPYLLKKYGYFNMAFITNSIATVDKLQVSDFFDIAAPPSSMYRYANIIDYVIGSTSHGIDSLFSQKIKFTKWIFHEDFLILNWLHLKSRENIEETRFPPEMAFNKFLNTLDQIPHRPFFVWIHIGPPHSPYLPPKPFKGMFDPSDKMKTFKSVGAGFKEAKESISKHNKTPDNFKTLVARYDEFIRYCDNQFEDFIVKLRNMNNINNTIILLSSDHGEIFSHKALGHGDTLHEPETNIPLIIKEIAASNRFGGRVINERVEQIDIPATILDLSNIPVPVWMEGRSLVPLMQGDKLPPRPAFSMILEKNRSLDKITKGIIAVWDGDYKLIHDYEDKESFLFNLKEDPDENHNIFDKEPETSNRLLAIIKDKIKDADEKAKVE